MIYQIEIIFLRCRSGKNNVGRGKSNAGESKNNAGVVEFKVSSILLNSLN